MPNGIDTARLSRRDEAAVAALRRTLGIPPTAPVIGTIGRLSEVKRQDVLLRAFAQVRSSIPDAHLVVVGDGPLMQALRSLASDLGLEQACHLVGYKADPESYLNLMDMFALTSRSEGMPLVVLEAWAAGVPVIASRVGGLRELVSEGENGLLVESGNEHELTTALKYLVLEPGLTRRMGEAGRRLVNSRFDESCMAAEYESHYFSLLPS